MIPPCPFCSLTAERFVLQSELAVVIRDGFPVSPGHTLIIPKRHVGSFFEISEAERADLMALLARARSELEQEFIPPVTTSASMTALRQDKPCRTSTST